MGKSQYKFSQDDIHFKKVDSSFKYRFWRIFSYIIGALFLALILNFVFILLFDSPSERMVRRENENLMEQYQILQDRKATVDTVFKEISRTDENIFRLIFETEPAKSNVGGLEFTPYRELMTYTNKELVSTTAVKVDSLLHKVRNDQMDYDILRIKSEDKSDALLYIPSIQPIENGDLSRTASGFGYRLHPIYKIFKLHEGMDYTAPVGTPVIATADGRIQEARKSSRGQGNRVTIDHGYGIKSVYAHLNDVNTRQGRNVKRGDVIGTVGNTGLSSGPHLHYEVQMDGKAVNPINFYFMELSPEEYDRMITLSKNSGQSFD